ncbi:hypothetical protein AG1IA_03145 [Rhizoctonia solani AG-1 IA]|uniref:Uncharacterized protein n=1 Tax=Thanatephorus cucumeris (strain AG1-IA) TaxID=983506 RepID=L8WXN8_THACA|nr:hypothetical protein AG1IA_03145 [Rhizoctonia solani AG-1 IA]
MIAKTKNRMEIHHSRPGSSSSRRAKSALEIIDTKRRGSNFPIGGRHPHGISDTIHTRHQPEFGSLGCDSAHPMC